MDFKRYALYFVPPADAAWSRFATGWLGWDMEAGTPVPHPEIPGLPLPVSAITETPRRYGLHATIKPPFRLAEGATRAQLESACAGLCAGMAPLRLQGMALSRLGRFLALQPRGDSDTDTGDNADGAGGGDTGALAALAGACVARLDRFRAPPTLDELARRRAAGLTPRQEEYLTRWGYPYVLEEFRFHITLTGRLMDPVLAVVEAALARDLGPLLPTPFEITELALTGEDAAGRFHLLHRYSLSA